MRRLVLHLILFLTAAAATAGETNAPTLTLRDAEERALRAHPKITTAELRSLAAREAVTEARSPFFPTLAGSATVVGTDGDNNRIAAGGLNNPIIYDRGAFGLNVSWQLFDFGRAANLLDSVKLHARAEEQNVEATRAQIFLLVDTAYFSALQARAVLRVTQQTVATRQLLRDQVAALATNQLKSELDVSFADTALAEARMLASRAENEEQAAQARLAALLGEPKHRAFTLVDEPAPSAPTGNVESLIATALVNRPELARLRLERDAAQKFARAERALHYPTISAVGVGGVLPEHNSKLPENYLAAGINLNLPIFAGLQYESRRKAAELKAQAAGAIVTDEEDAIIRDVRVAWLGVNNAIERQTLAARLVETARRAFTLAEAKYKAGASSIAELAQGQLNETSAEIAQANARYEVLLQRSLLDFQTGALR